MLGYRYVLQVRLVETPKKRNGVDVCKAFEEFIKDTGHLICYIPIRDYSLRIKSLIHE